MGRKKINDIPRSGRANRREAHREKIESKGGKLAEADVHDEDMDDEEPTIDLSVNVCLWEFGQNDPKRFSVNHSALIFSMDCFVIW